jgi:hypothetical protein
MQVVAGVEAHAYQRVNKALTSILDAEVEAQCLVHTTEIACKREINEISCQAKKRIAKLTLTSCRAKKTIEKLQLDRVIVQNQCDIQSLADTEAATNALMQMKAIHADDLSITKMNHKSVIKDQQIQLQTAKIKYKSTIQEQQCRHAEQLDMQKDEMNCQQELIYSENEMIDGCIEDNREESRKSRVVSKLVVSKDNVALS